MPRETYPVPGQHPGRPRLVYDNPNPEFGVTRDQYEERLFRNAAYFNVVRFRAFSTPEVATTPSFRKALVIAHSNDAYRYLIYVVTHNGEAFCMAPKDHAKYAEIFLQMQKTSAE